MQARVTLVPMSEEEFGAYLVQGITHYAGENVRAGYWSPEEALRKSRAVYESLLPEGLSTKGHYLFTIQAKDQGKSVGVVWLGAGQGDAPTSGIVYDLYIDPRFRQRGYATEAMRLLEIKARTLGMGSLALHVFAHNSVAIVLYERLGYELASLNMIRRLTPRE